MPLPLTSPPAETKSESEVETEADTDPQIVDIHPAPVQLKPPDTHPCQILTNLRNARDVWGEGSWQHEACREVAEGYLRARGDPRGLMGEGGFEGGLEEMVGRMARMGLGGGVGGG